MCELDSPAVVTEPAAVSRGRCAGAHVLRLGSGAYVVDTHNTLLYRHATVDLLLLVFKRLVSALTRILFIIF